MKPGTTARPRRSTTRVRGPASARTSLSVPTAANLPSETANACAIRDGGSTAMTLPLMKISSGKLEAGRCAAAAVQATSTATATAASRWLIAPFYDQGMFIRLLVAPVVIVATVSGCRRKADDPVRTGRPVAHTGYPAPRWPWYFKPPTSVDDLMRSGLIGTSPDAARRSGRYGVEGDESGGPFDWLLPRAQGWSSSAVSSVTRSSYRGGDRAGHTVLLR